MPTHDSVAEAWNDYLANTKGLEHIRYWEVEPWAWRKLRTRLARIRKKALSAA